MAPTNISTANPLLSLASTSAQAKVIEPPCFHCGLKCLNTNFIDSGKYFCCTGCLMVYQFLNSKGMQDFYLINEHPGNTQNLSKNEAYQFEYLDDKDLAAKLIDYQYENVAVITLKIPGIHCASCVWLLENLHQVHTGIKKVSVNFLKKQARIHFDNSTIKLSDLALLLDKVGYAPEFSWKHFKNGVSQSSRQDILKLGVAGFCFGNVMMLSFPEYMSVDVPDKFKAFFGYVSLLLSLPVLLYSSRDWFVGAAKAISHRRLTLDIPIVTGLLILFSKSCFDVIIIGKNGYFDSLCAFIFFMLLARYFQKITFEKLSFTDGVLSYFPMAVTVKVNEMLHSIPFTKVKENDELLIRNGEVIPVESTLLSENGLIDYSYLSGESELKSISKNMNLSAGGKISGKAVLVKATKPVEGHLLEQIWEDSNRNENKQHRTFADRISPYFVATIVSIATITLLVQMLLGNTFGFGLFCFTSVLIITCPCALAISAPLVYGVMQRRLAKRGFFLRNGQILECLSEADTLVFDKTGTLTLADKEIIPIKDELTPVEKSAVGTLATNSIHPISKQLSKWNNQQLEATTFNEIAGCGIEGKCNTMHVTVGKYSWLKDLNVNMALGETIVVPRENLLGIAINQQLKAVYVMQDKFRDNWKDVLLALSENYELHLISGDQDNEKIKIESAFPNKKNIHFFCNPNDKEKYINTLKQKNRNVVMVGDGLNDQQALQASQVGIAVSENASHFSPASDIIMLGDTFKDLPYFIRVSHKAASLIKVNFAFSLLYNLVGVGIAVSGHLTPLVAAILMPLSSLTVVMVAVFGSAIVLHQKGTSK